MKQHQILLGILTVVIAIGMITKTTQAALIPAGAAAHYELNGDATDGSGNGADGTGVTDVTYSFDATRGKQVANFNGSSSEINVGASGIELTSKVGTPDVLAFTAGFWVRFDNPGNVNNQNVVMGTGSTTLELVGNGSWGGFGTHGGIGIVGGANAGDARAHNDTANAGANPISLFDGQWHHVVIGWEDTDGDPSTPCCGGRYKTMIWIDNIATDTDTNGADYAGSDKGNVSLILGKSTGSNGGTKYLSGSLSDVTFYDRKLTGSEVNDLYLTTQIPEPSSIVLALLGLIGLIGYAIRRKK